MVFTRKKKVIFMGDLLVSRRVVFKNTFWSMSWQPSDSDTVDIGLMPTQRRHLQASPEICRWLVGDGRISITFSKWGLNVHPEVGPFREEDSAVLLRKKRKCVSPSTKKNPTLGRYCWNNWNIMKKDMDGKPEDTLPAKYIRSNSMQ